MSAPVNAGAISAVKRLGRTSRGTLLICQHVAQWICKNQKSHGHGLRYDLHDPHCEQCGHSELHLDRSSDPPEHDARQQTQCQVCDDIHGPIEHKSSAFPWARLGNQPRRRQRTLKCDAHAADCCIDANHSEKCSIDHLQSAEAINVIDKKTD